MAGLIPQSFIDDLINRLDIVDVVSSRVQLKKTGKNYSACCPFHKEKTPSFTVSPDKQFYYCFGCGAGGNALGFVMDHDNLDFPQAVEELARAAGMEVPREQAAATRSLASQPTRRCTRCWTPPRSSTARLCAATRPARPRWTISRAAACPGRSLAISAWASPRPAGTTCSSTWC